MVESTQKTARREKLLDQGVTLLMAQGYHGTGLNEILRAVGMAKGSFYNYFESKEAFGAAIIQHYIEPFIQQLDGHLSRSEQGALTALRCYFDELIDALEAGAFKGGCLLGNLMGEVGDSSELCRASLQQAVERYRDRLQTGLQRAQQEGDVRSDLSARVMADLLVNNWQGALLRMKIDQSIKPLRACCDTLLGDYFKTEK